jgi:rhodanese-related sulfurtransferase
MYSILNWFKNSTLRSNLYRIIILFIFCYILIRLYKTSSGSNTNERVIIDVRTKTEWNEGHHPEAIHLPHEHISEYQGDKDKDIIVYCTTGRRANIAKQKLEEIGYTKVTVDKYSSIFQIANNP